MALAASRSGGRGSASGISLEIRVIEAGNATQRFVKVGNDAEAMLKKLEGSAANYNRSVRSTAAGQNQFVEALRRTATNIAAVQGPLGPIAGRLNSLATIFSRAGLAVAAFSVGVTAAVYTTLKLGSRAAELEQTFRKLDAIIRITGRTGEVTSRQLEEVAQRFGRQTLGSTEEARDVLSQLLTQPLVTVQRAKEILSLAGDIRSAFGGDLSRIATTLARGLEEPVRVLEQMRRLAGFEVPPAFTTLVRSLEQAGEQGRAFDLVLEALQSRMGGLAEDEAQGLTGGIDSLGEAWNRFMDAVAQRVGEVALVGKVVGYITGLLDKLRIIDLGEGSPTETYDLLLKQFEEAQAKARTSFPGLAQAIDDKEVADAYSKLRRAATELEKQEERERLQGLAELRRVEHQKLLAEEEAYQQALREIAARAENPVTRRVTAMLREKDLPESRRPGVTRALQRQILDELSKVEERRARRDLAAQTLKEYERIRDAVQKTVEADQKLLDNLDKRAGKLQDIARARELLSRKDVQEYLGPEGYQRALDTLNEWKVETEPELETANDRAISSLNAVGEAFLDMAFQAELSGDILKKVLSDILRATASDVLQSGTKPLQTAITSYIASFAHAQHGLDFVVPGTQGSVDDTLFTTRVSKGERVTITPRGGRGPGAGSQDTLHVVVRGEGDSAALAAQAEQIAGLAEQRVYDRITRERRYIQMVRKR